MKFAKKLRVPILILTLVFSVSQSVCALPLSDVSTLRPRSSNEDAHTTGVISGDLADGLVPAAMAQFNQLFDSGAPLAPFLHRVALTESRAGNTASFQYNGRPVFRQLTAYRHHSILGDGISGTRHTIYALEGLQRLVDARTMSGDALTATLEGRGGIHQRGAEPPSQALTIYRNFSEMYHGLSASTQRALWAAVFFIDIGKIEYPDYHPATTVRILQETNVLEQLGLTAQEQAMVLALCGNQARMGAVAMGEGNYFNELYALYTGAFAEPAQRQEFIDAVSLMSVVGADAMGARGMLTRENLADFYDMRRVLHEAAAENRFIASPQDFSAPGRDFRWWGRERLMRLTGNRQIGIQLTQAVGTAGAQQVYDRFGRVSEMRGLWYPLNMVNHRLLRWQTSAEPAEDISTRIAGSFDPTAMILALSAQIDRDPAVQVLGQPAPDYTFDFTFLGSPFYKNLLVARKLNADNVAQIAFDTFDTQRAIAEVQATPEMPLGERMQIDGQCDPDAPVRGFGVPLAQFAQEIEALPATSYAETILAGGRGSRFEDPEERPKVVYPIGGVPIVERLTRAGQELDLPVTLVLGGETALPIVASLDPGVVGQCAFVRSRNPRGGTGYGLYQAVRALRGFKGSILVINGDVPRATERVLLQLMEAHSLPAPVGVTVAATILTSELDNPTGYGRIVTRLDGSVDRIMEQKDIEALITEAGGKIVEGRDGEGRRSITVQDYDEEAIMQGIEAAAGEQGFSVAPRQQGRVVVTLQGHDPDTVEVLQGAVREHGGVVLADGSVLTGWQLQQIKKWNSALYACSAPLLWEALEATTAANKSKEYYATDIMEEFNRRGYVVREASVETELLDGVNTPADLEKLYREWISSSLASFRGYSFDAELQHEIFSIARDFDALSQGEGTVARRIERLDELFARAEGVRRLISEVFNASLVDTSAQAQQAGHGA